MSKKINEGSYSVAFVQSRKKLQQLSPDKISKLTLLKYDWANNCFMVDSFGHEIEISYPEGKVSLKDSDENILSLPWQLILLNYLSSSKDEPMKNELVSYRDLPHGNVFYPNIKTHILEGLGKFFSNCDRNTVGNVLNKLGFAFIQSKADLAARAEFVPRVPVQIQFWEGEEGMPSSCQILFDRSIADQIHIEDAAALCYIIKELIIKLYSLEEII
ncbi:MAG: hypothetical protein VR72_07575 [Clostridiaceae bacterium BRH_c20a]|nr:MAG: hypothetical protein VR72_07575 [Clostridiaceae bacterium BRH_c20a]